MVGEHEKSPEHYVVVPSTRGPLVPLVSPRPRDEIDELVDDLFGPPDDDSGPGPADAGFVVFGLTLVVWALVFDGPTAALVGGVAVIVLGIVLPLRSLFRRVRNRRRRIAVQHSIGDGLILHTGVSGVDRLIDAYERILAFGTGEADDVDLTEAVDAAHGALFEVASQLAGRASVTPEETAYIDTRAGLLIDIAAALSRRPSGEELRRKTEIDARLEVDEIGQSSVARLDAIRGRLTQNPDG